MSVFDTHFVLDPTHLSPTSLSLCCMCIALCLVEKVQYCNLIHCHHRCIVHMFKIYFALVETVNPESLKSSIGGSITEGSVELVSGLGLKMEDKTSLALSKASICNNLTNNVRVSCIPNTYGSTNHRRTRAFKWRSVECTGWGKAPISS